MEKLWNIKKSLSMGLQHTMGENNSDVGLGAAYNNIGSLYLDKVDL